jgi:hypothetical protein
MKLIECRGGFLDGEQVSAAVPEPFLVAMAGGIWRPAILPYDFVCGFAVYRYIRGPGADGDLWYQGVVLPPNARTSTDPHLRGV